MMIQEHAQHHAGGDGEEVAPAVVSLTLLHQPEETLVDELGGLERDSLSVPPEPPFRDAAEVRVHEGHHLVQGLRAARLGFGQEARDPARPVGRHGRPFLSNVR